MQSIRLFFLAVVCTTLFCSYSFGQKNYSWQNERPTTWAYDPGPSVETQKEFIDLHSEIPSFPGVSQRVMRRGVQKFRPAYGPIPWRMILAPNNVKILFIGQDGTHIAEAANRPGTAGFGGRAQDLAAFFGVEYSTAFMNAYAFTIKGQYGARGAPYLKNGKLITRDTLIPNDVWMMSQDQDSPITKWRNELLEKIIDNNRESLKLIVLFGGAAQDSIASFIESRGGRVGSKGEKLMKLIQVPEYMMKGAGGNNEIAVPLTWSGKDLYESLSGRSLNYSKKGTQIASHLLKQRSAEVVQNMVFTKAGPFKNGLLHPAQIGGYDLNKIFATSEQKLPTRSIKGLQLKTGKIKNDILVTSLPHPTFLSYRLIDTQVAYWEKELSENLEYLKFKANSRYTEVKEDINFYKLVIENIRNSQQLETLKSEQDNLEFLKSKLKGSFAYYKTKAAMCNIPDFKKLDFMKQALDSLSNRDYAKEISKAGYEQGVQEVGKIVEKDVSKLRPYAAQGWLIEADKSSAKVKNTNTFAKGERYRYGRSDIHNVYYDFGTPKNRMVSKSSAKRKGRQVIIFGDRSEPLYNKKRLAKMKSLKKPNTALNEKQSFINRASTLETRYIFDPGPSAAYARILKDLPFAKIYKKKPGNYNSADINAYNIKSHPSIGDYAHYRGKFEGAKVLILADPDGYDDLITSRALTGTRGQFLQGMMESLGFSDDYMLLKTVPFGMDQATPLEWQRTLDLTSSYREKFIRKFIEDNKVQYFIADGQYAAIELKRILTKIQNKRLFIVDRELNDVGQAGSSGISKVLKLFKSTKRKFQNISILARMANIPRSHLTYYARAWEGTSGDRVLNSTGDNQRGLVFLEVVPQWVVKQEFKLSPKTKESIDIILQKLKDQGFPMPHETMPEYFKRWSLTWGEEAS